MKKAGTENLAFLKVDHVGVLVRDIDKAIEHFQSLGIGPFEASRLTSFDRMVYGKPAPEGIKNAVKSGQMGDMKLELIQPVAGESSQKKVLEERGEGVYHIGFAVANLDEEVAKLVARGFKVISSARFVGGGGAVFFETDRVGGVIFELIQRPSP